MIEKPKRYRSPEFLEWSKRQVSYCCVCRAKLGNELHHFGPAGMGQKGSDLLVARVCSDCHRGKNSIQGKRRIGFERIGKLDTWCDILEDCIELLTSYIANLEIRFSTQK